MGLQDQINAVAAQQGATPTEENPLTSAVEERELVADGTSETYRVFLASGTIAYHKTFAGVAVTLADDYGHEDPDQVVIHECAAWRLAAAIGDPVSDRVCVCVLRTIDDEPGSLSLMVPGHPWGVSLDDTMGDHDDFAACAFFDSLIAQQDRHLGNLFFTGDEPHLIDHGFAFALPGDLLNTSKLVEWRHEYGEPRLSEWERDALDRLLDSDDLLGLVPMLQPARARALAARAQRMRLDGRILRPGVF